jgi:membrane protease YdiL (CAAX protease family)
MAQPVRENVSPESPVRRIFINHADSRLRTGWRLLLHLLLSLSLLTCFSFPLGMAFVAAELSGRQMDLSTLMILSTVASAPALLLATWVARRFLDKRSFVSLGLKPDRHAPVELSVGFLISGIQMASVFLAELALGWIRIEGWSIADAGAGAALGGLIGWVLVYVAVGFYEEITFRGYYLQNLAHGIGPAWGIAISSAVFGMFHLMNPGAGLMSTLGIALAGLYLSLAWWFSRRLWLPIGIHIGWNFFQGPVFGFPVSGTSSFRLLRLTQDGPITITGGPFGPEAGLIIIPAIALGVLLVILFTKAGRRPA